MENEDFMKEDKYLNLTDRFNLLLVYRNKRPAYLYYGDILMFKEKEVIKHIKEKFPIFKIKKYSRFSYLIYIKPLPVKKENEDKEIWLGKVLGYDSPMNLTMEADSKYKFRHFVSYRLLYKNKKIPIYAERFRYKKDFKSKLKSFNELGYKVIEEFKTIKNKENWKKIKNKKIEKEVIDLNIEPLSILFNLLLVYEDVRPVFYLMEWQDFDIKIIKDLKLFKVKKFEDGYLISKDDYGYPPKDSHKKIVEGVTELDFWLGRILGYSCPGQFINRPIYSGISYYVNGERFLSEICWDYENIRDKTKLYNKVAEKYNLKVTSEITKNQRVKPQIVDKLIRNLKNKTLKNNIKKLLSGEIKEFSYKGKENLVELEGFIIRENNKITLFD